MIRFFQNEMDKAIIHFDKIIERDVSLSLGKLNITVSVVETVSAGYLTSSLNKLDENNKYLVGSIFVNKPLNLVKLLNISPNLISKRGFLSADVTLDMAEKCRSHFKSDISIVVNGIVDEKSKNVCWGRSW